MTHLKIRVACSLTLFLFISVATWAQQTDIWNVSDMSETMYYTCRDPLAAANDSDVVVIGTAKWPPFARLLRRTTDGGVNWTQLRADSALDETWVSVAHPSPNLIVVVGDTAQRLTTGGTPSYKRWGLMLLSTDGGASWTRHKSDSNTQFIGLSMCDPQHGIIVKRSVSNIKNPQPSSIYDSLLRTTDGWKTWTAIAAPPKWAASTQVICLQPDVYFLRRSNGGIVNQIIARTTDGGAHWQESGNMPEGIDQMTFVDPLNGWAAGLLPSGVGDRARDRIGRTTDGGMTWTVVLDRDTGLMSAGLNDIAFADAENGIAVGNVDKILRTHDGGKTWLQEFPPSSVNPQFPLAFVEYVTPDFAMVVYNGTAIIAHNGEHTLLPPGFLQPYSYAPQDVNNITVEWTAIEGATSYWLQMAPDSIASLEPDPNVYDHKIVDTVLSGTSIALNTLRYNHRYYARIKARNATQESDWHKRSALFYTKPDAGTVAPNIITPPKGSENQPTTVEVTWRSTPGALSYDLQLCEQPDFSTSLAADVSQIPITSHTVTGLKPQTTYFVRVRANLASEITAWSSATVMHFFGTGNATSGVDETKRKDGGSISIYPNPVTGDARVELRGVAVTDNARLEIYNALGMPVWRAAVGETGVINIAGGELAVGAYRARLITNRGSVSVPFVVIR